MVYNLRIRSLVSYVLLPAAAFLLYYNYYPHYVSWQTGIPLSQVLGKVEQNIFNYFPEMASTMTLPLKRNHKWARNGKLDYARSARKWNIGPTEQTTFYVREGKLLRKHTAVVAPTTAATAEPAQAPVTDKKKKRFSIDMILDSFKSKKHPKKAAPAPTTGTTPTAGGAETGEAEVPADDVQNDLEYVVPVTIGTPGVTLNLDFDTGSSDLWVWGSSISANAASHTIYNPSASSTSALASGLTWNISYGDGSSASGDVYTDVVTLGGTLAIPNQAVEVAEKLSSAFTSGDGSDGLLGLAFPSINTVSPTQQATPVENMISQNLVSAPLFTVKLDHDNSQGFYTFGAIAPDSASGVIAADIQYTSVISQNGFWEFLSPTITVGAVTSKREEGNTAIADTGTTLLLLSDAACQLLYNQIPGSKVDNSAGGWVFPTATDASTLPTVKFAVGTAGLEYGIAPGDLAFSDAGNGMSFGSVQSRGQNPQDILGDVFLKRVYAVFEQTPNAPRIGFAQRALT